MRKLLLFLVIATLTASAYAQRGTTTFSGTVMMYGSGMNTRTVTRNFTLRLNGETPVAEASQLINTLQERGQDGLLDALDDREVGTFSLGNQVGVDVNAAFVSNDGDRLRVRAVFKRWIGFGELRMGRRSTDYPFGYLEIFIDPRTGRGEGTFIPAAQIRFRNRNGSPQIEIEDFGTFPGRVLSVRMSGAALR